MLHPEISAYIEQNRDAIVAILTRLASIPSVRGEASERAPFGRECRRALDETARIFAEYGIGSRISDDGCLIAEIGEGEQAIGIFAHSDVVPAGEDWTLTQPFEPREINGCLVGRGVHDNKSGITAALFASLAAKLCGFSSKIRIVVGSNEESGMADIAAYVENEPMPEVSLVPDCAFPVYRGEKGICRFYAVSRDKLEFIHDFSGGEAFNIVLGKASVALPDSDSIYAALESAANERLTLERESGEIRLKAEGISKHAALPDGSLNAALLAIRALIDSDILPEGDRKILESAKTLLENPEEMLGISATDPDFGRTTAANGIVSIRDGRLVLAFDIRFVQSDGNALLSTACEKLESLGFDAEPTRLSAGFKIPEDDPTLLALLRTYSEFTGDKSPKAALNAGGTYSRCLKNAFAVGTTLDWRGPCVLPSGHGGVHQPDEYLNIDGHLRAISLIAEMLLAIDMKVQNAD